MEDLHGQVGPLRCARNLAAFRDDRFNEILRLDRQNRFALHLTMMGHVRERNEAGRS